MHERAELIVKVRRAGHRRIDVLIFSEERASIGMQSRIVNFVS
jgi:hypothetical protein